MEHKELLLLLDFMYKGEVTLLQEELDSFLEAGGALGVKGLERGDAGQGAATGGAVDDYPWQENETITSASHNKVEGNTTTSSLRNSTRQGSVSGKAASGNAVQSSISGPENAGTDNTGHSGFGPQLGQFRICLNFHS